MSDVDSYGGIDKCAYEHMKTLAGALEAAREHHGARLHAGPLGTCRAPNCMARMELLRWAYHLEKSRENPDYRHRGASYNEVTQEMASS